jgi:hypothetical protein
MDQATFHVGGHLMQAAVQFANPSLLDEAIHSKCDIIRFGSEYCMYAIPNSESLKKAYESAISSGKSFVYVTPRLAEAHLRKFGNNSSSLIGWVKQQWFLMTLGLLGCSRIYHISIFN